MSHLDEGTLHALLDGELDLKEVSEIQMHLGSCMACGSRLQEVKQFLAEADRLVGALEIPSTAPHPRPEPSRAFAPSSNPPRNDPPREPEIWEPPPLLLPDAPDSQVQRTRWRRGLAWAAMVSVVLLGGRMIVNRIGPSHPMLSERDLTAARPAVPPAVASPEETRKPTPVPPAVATNQPKPARPVVPSRAAPLKQAPEPKAVAAGPSVDSTRQLSDSAGFAYEDSAPAGEAVAAGTVTASTATDSVISKPPNQGESGLQKQSDELATRRAAADALAELDRQRRRERANAATASLPPPRTDTQPPVAPPPPAPRTLEQRAQIYTRIGLDEANKQLGGPVHVIEGMTPQFIGLTPGRSVAGADPSRPVVRVVYLDSRDRVILLDQQRLRSGQAPGSVEGSLRWAVGDVMLYLRGEPSGDVLKTLQRRVR
jgi:anti-sigma factor RsiW